MGQGQLSKYACISTRKRRIVPMLLGSPESPRGDKASWVKSKRWRSGGSVAYTMAKTVVYGTQLRDATIRLRIPSNCVAQGDETRKHHPCA